MTTDDPDDQDQADENEVRSDAIRGAIAPPTDHASGDDAPAETPRTPRESTGGRAGSATDTAASQGASQPESVMASLDVDATGSRDLKGSRKHVNLYLDESLADALDARFAELAALCEQQRGTSIEKNRDFYPAAFEAAFRRDADIMDVLGVDVDRRDRR